MAISGATATDVANSATKLGKSREEIAAALNYTAPTRSVTPTGSSNQISVALANWPTPVYVDFGDGKPPSFAAIGATPVVRTNMDAGTYRVVVTGLDGVVKKAGSDTVVSA